jgi:hypothetical protein
MPFPVTVQADRIAADFELNYDFDSFSLFSPIPDGH